MNPPCAPVRRFNSAVSEVIAVKIFNLAGAAVISTPPTCNFEALTSPPPPYITDLLDTIAPADEPSTKLISSLLAVTPVSIFS